VKQGDRVEIVVTSDVADHVHLHGYDIMRDVAPGKTARIRFRANVPGRFEVELEDRGVQIADLTVKP
jgi:heme/copper-type cytochrome/quinol oxidase subunit 2